MTSSRRELIEPLVRLQLGCSCPPGVFDRIEEGAVELPGLAEPVRRIAIGGRLLLYLIEAEDLGRTLARLPLWVAASRDERDAAGMNRVRIVVTAADPGSMALDLHACFEALPGRDERIHLHVLPRSAIAGL